MTITLLLMVLGFAILIFGATWLVDGASALAKKHHIPDLVIGLTIVAFGTSAPELIVNSMASVNGFSEIVLGNIIGSNNFNLFIILGLAGLIYPISVKSTTAWREIPLSLFCALILYLLAHNFFLAPVLAISRLDGWLLLLLFIGFSIYVFKQLSADTAETLAFQEKSNVKIWSLVILGLVGLFIGGKLVVDNSIQIAQNFGISQKVIGLTIVAAGTSLPEMATSLVAAFKKNSDIAIGNIVGSNIFNILLILSVSALIDPVTYDAKFDPDLFILMGGTLFLLTAMFTGKKRKLDRWEAAVLFLSYAVYTWYLVANEF